ncbi:MAG: FAD-dependent oxidoreductase, partial [Rhizorhabdus sp.]|nr:FAD-dependent oxidoreductase [Rhizorhabdus sp.]
VIDGLRSHTQDMWRAASMEDRARFLRHLRPYWDVHRHRLAPPVAARIAEMRDNGRLQIVAGRTIAYEREGEGAAIVWRPRGSDTHQRRHVRRIINCSGPQGNLHRTPEPLLQQLVAQGLIRPDPLKIGIDVNPQSQVIGRDGAANPRLLAVGPMTRGAFWEIVAVPDIRVQTWAVARRLSNAHWVEGEGL